MRFLYKIHSGFDGFYPAKISSRIKHDSLRLRWKRYIDVVEKNSECWVFFHGPHKFEKGVYVKGVISNIDRQNEFVDLKVREYQEKEPLVSQLENERISEVVKVRYRQVFSWPKEWPAEECNISMCTNRRCEFCETFKKFSLIDQRHIKRPERLLSEKFPELSVVSAYWIIPPRCYWFRNEIIPDVHELTRRFYDFKLGEKAYAYPFALAIFKRLEQADLIGFDCIVPIPLSPDKQTKGELHRTRSLALEISNQLRIPVREYLSLRKNASKRGMLSLGYSEVAFRNAYHKALRVRISGGIRHILLVDDVITRGSTLEQTILKIREHAPDVRITVATAGQMIVKPVVADKRGFLKQIT